MSQDKRDFDDDKEAGKNYAHPFYLEVDPGQPEVLEFDRRFDVDEDLDRKGIYTWGALGKSPEGLTQSPSIVPKLQSTQRAGRETISSLLRTSAPPEADSRRATI